MVSAASFAFSSYFLTPYDGFCCILCLLFTQTHLQVCLLTRSAPITPVDNQVTPRESIAHIHFCVLIIHTGQLITVPLIPGPEVAALCEVTELVAPLRTHNGAPFPSLGCVIHQTHLPAPTRVHPGE